MNIIFNEITKEFHLYNDKISYIFSILENKQLGQLYFGKKIKHKDSFEYMLQQRACVLAPCSFRNNMDFSLEVIKQEYPTYGTGDYREPAYKITQENGSSITNFKYLSHKIFDGKKKLKSLPATYGDEKEVMTLEITLYDEVIECEMILSYSIFKKYPVITRSTKFKNKGKQMLELNRAMSLSLDLYDCNFDMLQLNGAWCRERHLIRKKIDKGIQSIGSLRGASGIMTNPFIGLARPETNENSGEIYGFALIYSGNFLGQIEVDSYDVSRITFGIHPEEFSWILEEGEEFQTPEGVMVYNENGINGMSQVFHSLFNNNLINKKWKNTLRPILLNNWEATFFNFDETKIENLAKKAKEVGIELFVLDDGWFGKRDNDSTSLGDWDEDLRKLPNGISGICKKINNLGLKFGLWFEPEMVNEISKLYENHPEWTISTPNREKSYGRNQYVLDFSNPEVVDYIFMKMDRILASSNIEYIKWDMNRNITEAFSKILPPKRQKEFFHRYILGVYSLYERLIEKYPNILFESCASGGGRFDAGMLYYAPQAWASDDTDAIERLEIQYGTSILYPISSIGSHISATPNHQVLRNTSLDTRANVAYFGTFGYELDLTRLSEEELSIIKEQIKFFKENREVIQYGNFYRLLRNNRNLYSWMCVKEDKTEAIVAYYKVMAEPNPSLKKIRLQGLDPEGEYYCKEKNLAFSGSELMNYGLQCEVQFTGLIQGESYKGKYFSGIDKGDFTSFIYTLKKIK